jgi:hypothetical protein
MPGATTPRQNLIGLVRGSAPIVASLRKRKQSKRSPIESPLGEFYGVKPGSELEVLLPGCSAGYANH